MTIEAWDTRYKPNQDWNHAWGAAPANVIVRKLMRVESLMPAFETVQPQPDTLRQATLQLATLSGPLHVAFENVPGQFILRVSLPGNTRAVVYLPRKPAKSQVRQNSVLVKATHGGDFWKLYIAQSGAYEWEVR